MKVQGQADIEDGGLTAASSYLDSRFVLQGKQSSSNLLLALEFLTLGRIWIQNTSKTLKEGGTLSNFYNMKV